MTMSLRLDFYQSQGTNKIDSSSSLPKSADEHKMMKYHLDFYHGRLRTVNVEVSSGSLPKTVTND